MMGRMYRVGVGWAAAAGLAVLLAVIAPAVARAAACPSQMPMAEAPPGLAMVAPLADLLRQPPRQPSSRLERTQVTTEGWLLRVRALPTRAACQADTYRTAMIWLGVKRPTNLKRPGGRHAALVALVALPVLRDRLGSEQALDKLIGSRIRVTGLLGFNAARRGELNRTRGTLWEVRQVSAIIVCGNAECPPPPPPPPPVAAPPPEPTPAAVPPQPTARPTVDDDDSPDEPAEPEDKDD
jgi:hypothetical protein